MFGSRFLRPSSAQTRRDARMNPSYTNNRGLTQGYIAFPVSEEGCECDMNRYCPGAKSNLGASVDGKESEL